jgi:Cu(I)/Ag(I) efflux system membrane fusion protein
MKIFITVLAVSLAFWAGLQSSYWLGFSEDESVSDERNPLYWVAPMDASFRRDQPGKSPMGMDLIPVYAEDKQQNVKPGEVKISAAVENNLGVKTVEVAFSALSSDIDTVGYIQFDEDRLHHVHLRVDGWIEKLNVSAVGERVSKGQQLFELYSPTLHNAQKDLLSTLRVGGAKLVASAKQRLRLLGLSSAQIQAVVDRGKANERMGFYALSDGVVSALNVRHGMYVEPATEVMAIGSLETVWVIAEVFERQAAWLAEQQTVQMTVDSYPGEQWQATVDYIYPVLNAQSRTVQVRVKIDNADHRLRPNMFVNLVIYTQQNQLVLHIPSHAIIRGGHQQRVVKVLGDGHYRSVPVRTGREANNRVEILSGLSEGDRVVTSSQFLIDSESNIAAEMERHEASHSEGE